MSYKYDIILYWSEEDEAFIAEVPDLPGCAADGPTYEAALSAVQMAMDIWIETVEKTGRPIPEPLGEIDIPDKPGRMVMPPGDPDAELVEKIITFEPGKRSGQACIRGMRLAVKDVIGYLEGGMTEEEVLHDFPELTAEDIAACRAADRVFRQRSGRLGVS